MDMSALFKITYGLFVASAEYDGKRSGCIINTASQATAEPPKMLVTMLKQNLTTELIAQKKSLAVSILSEDAPISLVAHFGLQSGRVTDKFAALAHTTDQSGNPALQEHTLATLALSVTETIDLGTHLLFICDVADAREIAEGEPLTYSAYRRKKFSAGESAPAKYVCGVCHYVYDGETPFEDLPEDYLCPVCKRPKSVFAKA